MPLFLYLDYDYITKVLFLLTVYNISLNYTGVKIFILTLIYNEFIYEICLDLISGRKEKQNLK